jgi:hypothetical protein
MSGPGVPLADEDAPGDAGEVAVGAGVGPRLPLDVADGLPPGVTLGLPPGGTPGLPPGGTPGLPLGVADGLAETGVLGASCVQAAMTTRSLAGSALPPTPLRSTK